MPSTHSLPSATVAGPSSRKRPYAEITRSESRSSSRDIPSKRRRRTLRSSSISSESTALSTSSNDSSLMELVANTNTPSPQLQARRIGDGLDFRRPLMATDPNSQTIDLTADDDTPPPPSTLHERHSSFPPPPDDYDRPSPFGDENIEIIALSDSDDEIQPTAAVRSQDLDNTHPLPRLSLSPEVEFVSERPARPNPRSRPASRNQTILPPPQPARAGLGDQAYLGFGHIFRSIPDAFNRIVRRTGAHETIPQFPRLPFVGPPAADDFEELQLDYQQPAFAIGGRESETPQTGAEPYKEPPAAREGFTRNIEEDEILICPFCGDELASGEGEIKQQVWVIKQCGHVYCGECVSKRTISSKKDRRNPKNSTAHSFKTCKVAGCEKSVQTKGAMFQIYL